MTVINTLVTGQSAYMVTDGGWTDIETGKLLDIADKVQELPTALTAFSAIGGAWVGPYLAQDAAQQPYQNYEEVVRGIAERLPTTIREVREQVPGAPQHWGEFAVVFVGRQDGPRADLLHVIDNGPGEPSITRRPAKTFRAFDTGKILHADDIEGTAIELLESQRVPDEESGPVVATGFIQLTTVTAEGIKKKILRRLADEISEKIAPTK